MVSCSIVFVFFNLLRDGFDGFVYRFESLVDVETLYFLEFLSNGQFFLDLGDLNDERIEGLISRPRLECPVSLLLLLDDVRRTCNGCLFKYKLLIKWER